MHDSSEESASLAPTGSRAGSTEEAADEAASKKTWERPKFVFTRSLDSVAYIVHFLTLSLTVVVIALNIRNVYFRDHEDDPVLGFIEMKEILSTLQFVAKLHEVLMVASLTAIVFHFTRNSLLGAKGVPLGLMSAPFKIGAPDYLISPELTSNLSFRCDHLFLATAILFCTVLAIALGPASAIGLIPSLSWWDMSGPFSGMSLPIYAKYKHHELWPQTLTPGKSLDCHTTIENTSLACPSKGFHEIERWVQSYVNTGESTNLTIVESIGGARRRLASYSYNPYDLSLGEDQSDEKKRMFSSYYSRTGPMSLSTTSSHQVLLTLGTFWKYLKSKNVGSIAGVTRPKLRIAKQFSTYEPIVGVRCSAYRFNENNVTFESLGWEVPKSAWNYTQSLTKVNFTWIDLSGSNINASIAALFVVPIAWGRTNVPNDTKQDSMIVPCTIEARWIASEVTYDPGSTDIVKDNVTDLSTFLGFGLEDESASRRFGASAIIKISPAWADLLNLRIPSADSVFSPNTTTITRLVERFMSRSKSGLATFGSPKRRYSMNQFRQDISEDLATVLGLYLADAISRQAYLQDLTRTVIVVPFRNSTAVNQTSLVFQTGWNADNFNVTYTPEEFNANATNWTRYEMDVQRWGYGYGVKSKTSRFSVSILSMYLAVVVGYLIWFHSMKYLRGKAFWALTTNRWSNIGELLALAINSPSSAKLDGTCAGVDEGYTWALDMRVRDVGDSHLGLIVGEGENGEGEKIVYSSVDPSIAYGSLRHRPRNEGG
ncbi:hypothetical protein AJ79_00019 [Helicocarpus griseus UAMH5409]|uniref:Uncharacterized protein n=1 Tax=Helicocarpus griseus UAMH5409 TaxID=1447875 RepID=A0A2B7YBS2_9EURO|nr:hypothetical protein AJ79_00019 [Helicocarpus griseus UAMH5409]